MGGVGLRAPLHPCGETRAAGVSPLDWTVASSPPCDWTPSRPDCVGVARGFEPVRGGGLGAGGGLGSTSPGLVPPGGRSVVVKVNANSRRYNAVMRRHLPHIETPFTRHLHAIYTIFTRYLHDIYTTFSPKFRRDLHVFSPTLALHGVTIWHPLDTLM